MGYRLVTLFALILLGWLMPAAIGAQQLTDLTPAAPLSGLSVTVSPLTVLGPRQRFTGGVAYATARGWNYGVDLSYGPQFLPQILGSDEIDYQLFEGRIEVRREFGRYPGSIFTPKRRHYVGLQFAVRDAHRVLTDGGFYTRETVKIDFDQATQLLRRYEIIAAYTLQAPLGERFGIEGYGGLGMAYRDRRYVDMINPEENPFDALAVIITTGVSRLFDKADEAKGWVPVGRFGLRVTYLLSPAK